MIVAIPVTADGHVGHSWGKAPRVAITRVTNGELADWTEHDVRWDLSHDTVEPGRHGGHGEHGEHGEAPGEHHARIVRFLREQGVTDIVADHVGPGMVRTLEAMRIPVSRRPAPTPARPHAAWGTDAAGRHPRRYAAPGWCGSRASAQVAARLSCSSWTSRHMSLPAALCGSESTNSIERGYL